MGQRTSTQLPLSKKAQQTLDFQGADGFEFIWLPELIDFYGNSLHVLLIPKLLVLEGQGMLIRGPFLERPGNLPGPIRVFGDKCFLTKSFFVSFEYYM